MATSLSAPNQFADVSTGPTVLPGLRVTVPNALQDVVLYYVNTSTGVVTIKDTWTEPTATDVAVKQYGMAGAQEWVYVKNDTGSAISRGQVVAFNIDDGVIKAAYEGRLAPANAAPGLIVGVAQHAIPANNYAWVLANGVGLVQPLAAAIAAGANITPAATAGSAVAAAASAANIGIALQASVDTETTLILARITTQHRP